VSYCAASTPPGAGIVRGDFRSRGGTSGNREGFAVRGESYCCPQCGFRLAMTSTIKPAPMVSIETRRGTTTAF